MQFQLIEHLLKNVKGWSANKVKLTNKKNRYAQITKKC